MSAAIALVLLVGLIVLLEWAIRRYGDDKPAGLKTLCAWCGLVLKDGPDKPLSHGICLECADKIMEEYHNEKEN